MTDYKLPKEKIRECKIQFDIFDKDKDKAINKKELGDLLRTLGENFINDELNKMMNLIDKDESGKIEFKEFLSLYELKMRDNILKEELENKKLDEEFGYITENEYVEAFKLFDKDNTGIITVVDLKNIMTTLGDNMNEDEIIQLANDADYNNEGFIDYRVFVRFMMNKLTVNSN